MNSKLQRSITVEGRTVQEAIARGLDLLGATRSRVTITILSEENKGLFGMRGLKPAKVRLALKKNEPT